MIPTVNLMFVTTWIFKVVLSFLIHFFPLGGFRQNVRSSIKIILDQSLLLFLLHQLSLLFLILSSVFGASWEQHFRSHYPLKYYKFIQLKELMKLFWSSCLISLILLYGSSVTKSIIFCFIDSSNLGFLPDPGLLSKLQFSLY